MNLWEDKGEPVRAEDETLLAELKNPEGEVAFLSSTGLCFYLEEKV